MTKEEQLEYSRVVESLLYLDSSLKIKEAVRSYREFDKQKMTYSIDLLRQSYLDENNNDDYELLSAIKELLHEELYVIPDKPAGKIESVEQLLVAAEIATNSIQIRSLIKKYWNLFNEEVLRNLQVDAVENYRLNKSLDLFCIAALTYETPEWYIQAKITWSAYLREEGFLSEAERHLKQARSLLEAKGIVKLKYLVIAAQIGISRAKKDFELSLQLLEEIIDTKEVSTNYPQLISCHKSIAQIAFDLEKYFKSLDHLNRLIKLLTEVQNPMWEELSKSYTLRGLVQEQFGRYEKGFSDYQEACSIAERLGDRSNQFVNMNNMAASLLKRNLEQQGLDRFRDILRIVSRWGNPGMIASTHNNLGQALLTLHRYGEALSEFQLGFQFKINSRDKRGEAISCFGMADAMKELGDEEGAETMLTIALMSGLETGDIGTISMYASRMNNLKSGKSDMETLQWALGAAKANKNTFFEATLIGNIGKAYINNGERDNAVALYENFFDSQKEYPLTSTVHLNALIGYAEALVDNNSKQNSLLDMMFNCLAALQKEAEEVLFDERRAEIMSSSIRIFNPLFKLLLDNGNDKSDYKGIPNSILTFNLHESAKSRSFISNFSGSYIEQPETIPVELRRKELGLLAEEQSYRDQVDAESESFRMDKLAEIQAKLSSCWEEIRVFAPEYVRFRLGDPYTFVEMQKILSAQENAAVAIVSFFCDEFNTTSFVLKSGCKEPFVFRSPVGSKEIEDVIHKLSRTFNGNPDEFPPYPPIIRDKPYKRNLDFLYELSPPLLQFLSVLENVDVIVIAPHGPLHSIPFHALKMADGSYLASHYAVSYTPSLSVLMQMLSLKKTKILANPSVFVAGVSAEGDLNPQFFEKDSTVFDSTYFSITSSFGIQQATCKAVVEAFSKYDIVHLSCHGYFDKRDVYNSGLLFSDSHTKPPRDIRAVPFMKRKKYLVTIRDILKMRMQADLVTLNACSTGVQRKQNDGDEMEGLLRSFLLSGASTVVSTLWNIDQESSGEFLNIFYTNWRGDSTFTEKCKALNFAQRNFISSKNEFLRHPYHWAAYTLNGKWK